MYTIICYSDIGKENSISVIGVTDNKEKAIKIAYDKCASKNELVMSKFDYFIDIDYVIQYRGCKLDLGNIEHEIKECKAYTILKCIEETNLGLIFDKKEILKSLNLNGNEIIYNRKLKQIDSELLYKFAKCIVANNYGESHNYCVNTSDCYVYSVIECEML